MSEFALGGALRGRRIVVTRPAEQNQRLVELIRAEGGEAVVFPTIEIVGLGDSRAIEDAADRLETYDLAVFISPNAVDQAMSAIRARREWPRPLRAATIGRASADALRRHGVSNIVAPSERFDSEALLELAALADVAGWRIVIFRGEGGRELLGDTLRQHGAIVDYVECYRRQRPNVDSAPLAVALSRGEIDAVIATSSEGLRNFVELIGAAGEAHLKRTPLFVPHFRIAEVARSLGCERVVETLPGDEGLAAGLARFWAKM